MSSTVRSSDKLLFTPGPLSTSATTKQAMLRDLGSRDVEFLTLVRELRTRLLRLAEVAEPIYAAIPLQGSGTYAVEAALGTVVPRDGKLLILVNGAYGERLVKIADVLAIHHTRLDFAEGEPIDVDAVEAALDADAALAYVVLVHCETSTGLVNPLARIAAAVQARGRCLLVDAMSSFGALPISVEKLGIDVLITSANKCLQGVPGCGIVIARRARIEACAGHSRSLSLDLCAQLRGLDQDGQFRFTPPTHVLLALAQALDELDGEGGISGRGARYAQNQHTLLKEMRRLGFRTFLPDERLSPIITSFLLPEDPRFEFTHFYQHLSQRGFVIYPGKVSRADCFRIGTIGHVFPSDVANLSAIIEGFLRDIGVSLS